MTTKISALPAITTPNASDLLPIVSSGVTSRTTVSALGAALNTGAASQVLSVRTFTAVGDGVADDTAAIQACFNAARDAGQPWVIPVGTYRVSSVVAYTGGTCYGTLVSANDSTLTSPVFEIASVAADIAAVSSVEVNSYTNMVRGANKLGGLINRHGQFLYIDSTDVLIGRLNNPDLAQGDCFLVDTDDGYISPPLYNTWTLPGNGILAFAKTLRAPITITGLAVQLDGTASGERNCAIQVSRPNTKLTGCRVTNVSTGTVQQGFKVQSACNVTFDTCIVDNMGVNGTNYAWQTGFAANVELLNCSQTKCRRGVDSQRSKGIRIVGGSFPSGVGAHYAWGFSVSGATLGADNNQNGHAVLVSGGDFVVRDNDITISGVATAAVRVRSDLFEAGGKLVISGNRIVFDDTDGSLADTVYVADLHGQNTSAYDAKRTVEMPRLIAIANNAVSLLGASSTTIIEVISFLMDFTSFAQPITCSGTWEVSGNDFQYANGNAASGTARSHFVAFKPATAVGSGYQIHLADLPGVYVYSYCAAAQRNASTRHDWVVERTGTTNLLSLAYGTFRRAIIGSEYATFNFPGGTSGYAAIGDEVRERRSDLPMAVNVRDTGAKGDGTTTDTTAFQAAMDAANAAGGGTVFVPPGTYRVQNLYARNRVKLLGAAFGSVTLKVVDGVDAQVILNQNQVGTATVDYFEMENLICDGNKSGAPRANASAAVAINGVTYFAARNCIFQNASGYALGFQAYSAQASGIHGVQTDIFLQNCHFLTSGDGRVNFDTVNLVSSLSGTGGTAVIQTATSGVVGSVRITAGGTGYAAGETVTMNALDGTGTGATGTVTVSGGAVTGVTITTGGTGYTPADTYDGLDIKDCDRLVMIGCRALNNVDRGINIRGEQVTLIGCYAEGNGFGGSGGVTAGFEMVGNSSAAAIATSLRMISCESRNNGGAGFSFADGSGSATQLVRCEMLGCQSSGNGTYGIEAQAGSPHVELVVNGGSIQGNTGHGISLHNSTKSAIIDGAVIRSNGGSAIYTDMPKAQVANCRLTDNTRYGVEEGSNATRTILSGATVVTGNTLAQFLWNANGRRHVAPTVIDFDAGASTAGDIIASAATLTLPEGGDCFFITGTTTVTGITLSRRGRVVSLQFTGTGIVLQHGTLFRLPGGSNITTTNGHGILTMMCDGSTWRCVNWVQNG